MAAPQLQRDATASFRPGARIIPLDCPPTLCTGLEIAVMKKWARKTGCLGRQDEKVPTDETIPNWRRVFKKERAFRLWRSDAGPNATWADFTAKPGPWARMLKGTWWRQNTAFSSIDAALAFLHKDYVYRRWDGDGIEKTWRSFLQTKWTRVLCAARQLAPARVTTPSAPPFPVLGAA